VPGRRSAAFRDLPPANAARAAEDPILLVSGFGAHRVLAAEAGLHVFEPSEGATSRVAARVCVDTVPLGQLSAAEERSAILAALNTAPRPNSVVRRYRKQPPLVRDAAGQWRTGRLDLVLGGAFDLLQDVAG
jgi:ATP-dependent Clp protease ATP-binding subunit ClpC